MMTALRHLAFMPPDDSRSGFVRGASPPASPHWLPPSLKLRRASARGSQSRSALAAEALAKAARQAHSLTLVRGVPQRSRTAGQPAMPVAALTPRTIASATTSGGKGPENRQRQVGPLHLGGRQSRASDRRRRSCDRGESRGWHRSSPSWSPWSTPSSSAPRSWRQWRAWCCEARGLRVRHPASEARLSASHRRCRRSPRPASGRRPQSVPSASRARHPRR